MNENKTLPDNRNKTDIEQGLRMDREVVEGVQNFRYLGALIS
jgi:hypothetical protein